MATLITLNCARIKNPSLETIDHLARLQLGLRRGDHVLSLVNLDRDLEALIGLAGLGAVLGVEVQRQPEEREQLGGVEKERELGDPTA